MPSGNGSADIVEYNDILAEIDNVITQYPNSTVVIGGDFNADLSLPRNMWENEDASATLVLGRDGISNCQQVLWD